MRRASSRSAAAALASDWRAATSRSCRSARFHVIGIEKLIVPRFEYVGRRKPNGELDTPVRTALGARHVGLRARRRFLSRQSS